MFDNVRDIYFAGHHLTRDLIGNVAPLTAVCALVTLGSPSAREFALTVFQSHLAGIGFWTFVLILMAYLAMAAQPSVDWCGYWQWFKATNRG